MNILKKLKDLRGQEYQKSLPSKKEIAALPLVEEWSTREQRMIQVPDIENLEKETIQNVILNCLTFYKIEDKKEAFYVNQVASYVLEANKDIELKDKLKSFLVSVLESSIIVKEKDKEGKEQEVGVYAGWVIVQVLEEVDPKLKDKE